MTRLTGTLALSIFAMIIGMNAAHAERVCKVTDPTGTPLNIRDQPNGKVINKLRNEREVYITETTYDDRSRPWVYLEGYYKGEYRHWGWAIREFVSCYDRQQGGLSVLDENRVINKSALIFVMFFLVCSCSSDITIQNTDTQYSDTQTQQVQTADTREIEIGRAFSLDQIKSISLFDSELNKLYDVECGGFFTVEDGEEEAVYQYGNMTVDITGDQGAIMRVIGIPDGLHIKYNELLIDNNFNPKSLSLKQFEIHENKATVSDNIVGIESTDIKTVYDTEYLIREKTSDELLYLSFLGNKLVAIRVLVQC